MLKTTLTVLAGGAVVLAIAMGACALPGVAESAPAKAPVSADSAFLADVRDTPGLATSNTDAELLRQGHWICGRIGQVGVSRLFLELMLIGATQSENRPFAQRFAPVLVDASHKHLCPGKLYSTVVVTTPPTPAPVPESPVVTGPDTVIAQDDEYEVGVDIMAGKWASNGGDGQRQCFWARRAPGPERKTIDNHIGGTKAVVWVKDGELFEVAGCGTWTRVSDK